MNKNTLPALPAYRRIEDHPKVKQARDRMLEAGRKFDQVNTDAAHAAGMLKEKRHQVLQLQARVAMGDADQSVLDRALEEQWTIESRAVVYGDFDAARADFVEPYESAFKLAIIEAAAEIEESFADALEPRLERFNELAKELARLGAEIMDVAPNISRINHAIQGRGVSGVSIREPWKNGQMGIVQRVVNAAKPIANL